MPAPIDLYEANVPTTHLTGVIAETLRSLRRVWLTIGTRANEIEHEVLWKEPAEFWQLNGRFEKYFRAWLNSSMNSFAVRPEWLASQDTQHKFKVLKGWVDEAEEAMEPAGNSVHNVVLYITNAEKSLGWLREAIEDDIERYEQLEDEAEATAVAEHHTEPPTAASLGRHSRHSQFFATARTATINVLKQSEL